ncbi:GrdX family protein [Anaerosalibacter sp. Marseille-P3206]|uniref:GrdX family protein n=1 Tax=Anaerosalibacter sp. Marseille-P3206 TaxID=1871005 RepID=UPI000985D144|nr:GrdX family protein [Anaerosalibacter sp. Marseille-P3206]
MGNNIIITNNPLVKEKYDEMFLVEYYDLGFLELLELVRDKIHLGYKLLTHPLSSSVKPNETPYKTIIVSTGEKLDNDSLLIIENGILTAKKLIKDTGLPKWNESILEDFQVVDLSVIEGALNRL